MHRALYHHVMHNDSLQIEGDDDAEVGGGGCIAMLTVETRETGESASAAVPA